MYWNLSIGQNGGFEGSDFHSCFICLFLECAVGGSRCVWDVCFANSRKGIPRFLNLPANLILIFFFLNEDAAWLWKMCLVRFFFFYLVLCCNLCITLWCLVFFFFLEVYLRIDRVLLIRWCDISLYVIRKWIKVSLVAEISKKKKNQTKPHAHTHQPKLAFCTLSFSILKVKDGLDMVEITEKPGIAICQLSL